MPLFSRLPERQLHRVRWLLLLGWLLLILSLLLPALTLPPAALPGCPPAGPPCRLHGQPGNRLFWGTVVPLSLLLIGAVSHELWRRICPLAFVSQLARALGWQRTRADGRGGHDLAMVDADSWLGRHHLALQWSLLIAGLCLRLLLANSHPVALAVLLLVTLAAAVVVGWAWGGKAWCQYVCPMGPVQTVLTGLRGPLGSSAHRDGGGPLSQSMCRTIAADGRERSACVACQTPCIDIDAERAFWQNLRGRRSLGWAWFSYPGLCLGFVLLMERTGAGSGLAGQPGGYLGSGAWAFDADLPRRALQPLGAFAPLPRLLAVPLLLTAAAALSAALFGGLEALLQRRYRQLGLGEPQQRASQHCRLLAGFTAINSVFAWVDPLQGSLGDGGAQLLRSLVLVATAIGLFRSWKRDPGLYRRESVGASLRRRLHDLPGLEEALDGRSLAALAPQEVFTLVKAMPALERQQARSVYHGVMAEMLRGGRLDRAGSLLELQELRQTLHLEDADHHAVVRLLARDQPELLQRDRLQRQADDLRREAAAEGLEDLLRLSGLPVLQPETLRPAWRQRLERLRLESGLDPEGWSGLLQRYGPKGEPERRRLEDLRNAWLEEAGLQALLAERGEADPLLRPLARALALRVGAQRRELQPRLEAAGLEALPGAVAAAGELGRALDLLWHDPDPDTAGWVLMLARGRDPQRLAACLQDPRPGLGTSPFLDSQRRGDRDPDGTEFAAIATAELFADLLPEGILRVARQGHLHQLAPEEMLMRQGTPSDALALVVTGDVWLRTADDQRVVLGPGQTVGEMGVITGRPRSADVRAGSAGAQLLVLPAPTFEDLLRRSPRFSRGLLVQLAQRLAPADQRRQ